MTRPNPLGLEDGWGPLEEKKCPLVPQTPLVLFPELTAGPGRTGPSQSSTSHLPFTPLDPVGPYSPDTRVPRSVSLVVRFTRSGDLTSRPTNLLPGDLNSLEVP